MNHAAPLGLVRLMLRVTINMSALRAWPEATLTPSLSRQEREKQNFLCPISLALADFRRLHKYDESRACHQL